MLEVFYTPKNIHAWSQSLRDVAPDLSSRLAEDRNAGFARVEQLGLPHYKRNEASLEDFGEDPNKYLDLLKSREFYIVLSPKKRDLPRFSRDGMNTSDILSFIGAKIAVENRSFYMITVLQYFENLYGGNIAIGNNGRILIEFTTGRQGSVASGEKTPEFSVVRDRFMGSLKYSFENPTLRQAIYNTLLHIPYQDKDTIRNRVFKPGYYEFALVNNPQQQSLSPIFTDYKGDPLWFEI